MLHVRSFLLVVFLSSQAPYNLPQAVNFDPYSPKINLDSKKVLALQDFAVALKEHLTEIIKQPIDARLPLNKPGGCAGTFVSRTIH